MSDSFDIRQQEVEAKLRDKNDDYFLDPADFDTDEEYAEEIETQRRRERRVPVREFPLRSLRLRVSKFSQLEATDE